MVVRLGEGTGPTSYLVVCPAPCWPSISSAGAAMLATRTTPARRLRGSARAGPADAAERLAAHSVLLLLERRAAVI